MSVPPLPDAETAGGAADDELRPAEDFEPDQPAPRPATGDWAIYRRLLGYVRPHWLLFLVAVIGFQLGSGAEAYFVSMLGDLIDSWPKATLMVPVMMLVAAVARGTGEILGEVLLSRISFSVVHDIRLALFEQLLMMPSAYFDASSQGHLVSRITYNVAQLRNTGTDALKTIVQDGGKLIVYLGVMLWLSWKLTLIFVATAPVVGLVVLYASRRFRRISRRIQNSMGDVTHVASETVSGYRVVRIFGGEDYERERFDTSSDNNRRQNLKMVATKVTSTHVIQIFVAIALSVLVAVLFQPEIGGHLSTGDVVTFLGLAGLLARPIKKLTEVNARLQRGLAAAEDVFGQLDQPIERDDGRLEADRVEGRLEFNNVSFRYQSGAGPVLKNLNLTIQPGQTVALVGKSGSGKSTLASLIPRFYEADAGEILLDGKPLTDYRLSALRGQIALVTQQVTLFNDTLENNIAYGSLAATEPQALREAIERAHADVFIDEQPEGLQTIVGDDGVLLSGGQRQRVAIARALLKDAPLLILDEATSALDATSERHIQAALEEVMRGRTTLVIAHRLSTIENADVILVMQDGQIIESGKHTELLAADGAYAELYNAQFEEEAAVVTGPDPTPVPAVSAPSSLRLPAIEQHFSPLVRAWYRQSSWLSLLAPFGWLYGRASRRKRMQFLTGARVPWRAPVPVIVVGNITAGGTGKTPLVIWLAAALESLGFSPGILSRGHGGSRNRTPYLVQPDSPTAEAGDEPPLLATRTGCPVMICKDRVRAAQALLEEEQCDVLVCDDGLQHYALARDIEIAVIDGRRGIGNGRFMPAGPLREGPERLDEVDWVVSNGAHSGLSENELLMTAMPLRFVSVSRTADAAESFAIGEFVERVGGFQGNVNAVAGVGNPARFADTLRAFGLNPLLNGYPDHHRFTGRELVFDNDWPVVVTEKDATKIRELAEIPAGVFYLEIGVSLMPAAAESATELLGELLREHGIRAR